MLLDRLYGCEKMSLYYIDGEEVFFGDFSASSQGKDVIFSAHLQIIGHTQCLLQHIK